MSRAAAVVWVVHPSPVGDLLLSGRDEVLYGLHFSAGSRARGPADDWVPAADAFAQARRQLDAYFAGRLRVFSCATRLSGTPFQRCVWEALRAIPYGETESYAALARRLGKPTAVRAVGAANGRNPLPLIHPCHRVVGSDGSLTGFGGGLEAKRSLLALEAAHGFALAPDGGRP